MPNQDVNTESFSNELMARNAEIQGITDLLQQRGTPIPALFNIMFKFIQNPSTVSIETYKRMVDTDDTIGSGVDFTATLLAARLGSYQHPSNEITEWVNKALNMVDGGFHDNVKELASAMWCGSMVQEQVWGNTDHGFIVERLAPLPPTSVLYEVDRVGRLTPDGILQYQRAYNPQLLGAGGIYGSGFSASAFPGTLRPDPLAKLGDLPYPIRTSNMFQYLSIRIPVQKCIHYSFNAQGRFGSPYGRSLLRRAYNHWIMKNAFLQMLATAMDRKGTPILVVFADPNVTIVDSSKVAPGQNVQGNANVGIRAEAAALKAFGNVHNDSVVVLPGKKDQVFSVDPVQVQSNAAEFIQAINNCDKGSLRAMLLPSLIFASGDGSGSYSLGQEHARTHEKILDGWLVGLKRTLIDQHVRRMIMYNFPESAWKKDGFGDFSKRDFSQEEINKILEGYAIINNMGAIDMSDLQDLNKVREMAGFSLRDQVLDPLNQMARDQWGEQQQVDQETDDAVEAEGEGKGEDAESTPRVEKGDQESAKPTREDKGLPPKIGQTIRRSIKKFMGG